MFSFDYKNAYPDIINQYPKSSLGYKSNNKYPTFPPLMKDGRSVISSWNPESHINNKIIIDNNITSNWEYRNYLINNAISIMKSNFNETANDTGYSIVDYKYQQTQNNPFIYGSINENIKPKGYEDSDLKEIYLSREQLYSRKCVPTFTVIDSNNS